MPQYLCIDPGLSHTGISISDSTHLVEPLTTIHNTDQKKVLEKISLIIKQQKPDHIIIGQPSFGPIHSLAQNIFITLKLKFKGELHLFSEDLSSKIALKKLVQSGGSQQARRHKQHAAAAATILQDFLES